MLTVSTKKLTSTVTQPYTRILSILSLPQKGYQQDSPMLYDEYDGQRGLNILS